MLPALVIDDDVQLLASLRTAARLAKLNLVTAESWDEGLELFQALSTDLVVADFNMPGSKHGLRLLAEIRTLRPSVRLILVSGYLDEADMNAVMALGLVDRVLTKGSAVETAQSVMEEVRTMAARGSEPTDWVSYSTAFLKAAQVSDQALEKLDQILVHKIQGS